MKWIRLPLKLAGLLLLITAALCALALVWGISRRAPLLAAQIMSEATFDSDIYLIDPDVPKVINLTRDPVWLDVAPAWTPDNRLTYVAVQPRPVNNELRIYDLAAHHTEAVRLPLLTVESPLLWSPGGRLALVGSTANQLSTLFVADSSGGSLRDVTAWSHESDSYPVWLSDSEIAFVMNSGDVTSQVLLMDVDTGIWHSISDSRMINAVLVASPEERTIVFHGYNPGRIYSDEWNTFLWSESSGRVTIAADESFAGSIANAIRNGQVLVVKTVNGTTDIYRYDIKTRAWQNLTDDDYYETSAVWSPDGRIAYVANHDGAYGIYLLDPATGTITELLREFNMRLLVLAWSH